MAVIKLKQSDIEKIVTNIINEDIMNVDEMSPVMDQDDLTEPGPGKEELKLAYTEDGSPVLYKTNPNGEDELVKKF